MWRVEKVNSLIKKELGKIILKEIDLPPEILLTITRVEASSNLFQAKVFVSVMPEEKTEEIFKILNQNIFSLQQRLNKKLKMRPVPKISFVKEKRTVEAGRVEELLRKIKKEK